MERAATQGVASAQSDLGVMYQYGIGVTQSDVEAVKWFERAAQQGNAPAETNLGFMYAKGRGIKKDSSQAVTWTRKAADQGYAVAQMNLGTMYREGDGVQADLVEAAKWLELAAKQDSQEAEFLLGITYLAESPPTNDGKAIEWLQRASRRGEAKAKTLLDMLTRDSVGSDPNLSLSQLRTGADQGRPDAQRKLGSFLILAQDSTSAYMWLTIAADRGDEQSKKLLKLLPGAGMIDKKQIDEAKRRAKDWEKDHRH